jgi:dipeptidyl-peptidase-4
MFRLALLLFFVPLFTIAQKKQISIEDLYKKGTFRSEFVRPDFGVKEPASTIKASDLLLNGKSIGEPDDLIISEKYPNTAIIRKGIESIYRHSSKADVYVYDITGKKLIRLDEGKILHPTLSPDGTKVAYVKDNNLYIKNLANNNITAVTTDGKWNSIINGNADWVYEEEFSFTQAFQWSPNSAYLAYYKFDETNVKEYNMTIYDDQYNKDYRFKYPKVGEANSVVNIHLYHLPTSKDVNAKFDQGDIYIPRIKWTEADNKLVVFWMNRFQNHLKLLLTDPATGSATNLYEEKNKYYIDITDDWMFLKDGKNYLFTSEMNGYNQLYVYGFDGKKKVQVTKMKYDLTAINGVDEKNSLIYYTLAYPTPLDRNLFVSDFDGKKNTQLTKGTGTHRVVMNNDFTQYYDYHSTISTPQVVTLYNVVNNKGSVSTVTNKVINESNKLKELLTGYELSTPELIKFPNSKGDTLNGWMLKPTNFNAGKKYPVLFCNYGGPGSQQVANRFGAVNYWHHMLAQKGFIVVSVDNTGTGFRGEEFKKKTYLQLGKLEIEDQIDAAKWLAKKTFVDAKNIGHWGWSYGGFMSSLAVTKGAEVFTAGVAVAPVTSWRYYDNIYTERYMRTPKENAKGYDENAPINYVDKIRGKYLLIHGSADDNVHFQNSVQMVTALVKANVDFETMYYPNKNHGIGGQADNTTYHLWTKMTNWILENLGNENVNKTIVGSSINNQKKSF